MNALKLFIGFFLCFGGWFILPFVYFKYKLRAPQRTARVYAIIMGSAALLLYAIFLSMRPFTQEGLHCFRNGLLFGCVIASLVFPYFGAMWICRKYRLSPHAHSPQSNRSPD